MLKHFLPPGSTPDGETSGYGGRFILQSGADYCLNGGRRRSSAGLRSRGRGRGLAILCLLDGALLEEQRVGVGEIAGAGRDERSLGHRRVSSIRLQSKKTFNLVGRLV